MDRFAIGLVFVVGKGATERVGNGIQPEIVDAGGVFTAFDEFGFDVADGARNFVIVGDGVGEGGGFER